MIQLGDEEGRFAGSVGRVELYDFVLSEADRTAVRSNKQVETNPIVAWDNYDRDHALYVAPSQYSVVSAPGRHTRKKPKVVRKRAK